jgi:prepilin-type N-terminal cleavage/methylation domain-containing protein
MMKKFKIKSNLLSVFTLIELLVVIGIIGVLSAVVLASLNSARIKGADASVKSNLANMRSQADLWYSNNSETYGTWNAGTKATCPVAVVAGSIMNDPNIIKAIASALSAAGNGTSCQVSGGSYAIAVGMDTANQAWCVDSQGTSKLKTGVATPDLAITASACN